MNSYYVTIRFSDDLETIDYLVSADSAQAAADIVRDWDDMSPFDVIRVARIETDWD